MANYEEMYNVLFKDVTKIISLLQEAQRKTEEIYMLNEEASGTNGKIKSAMYLKMKIKQELIKFD